MDIRASSDFLHTGVLIGLLRTRKSEICQRSLGYHLQVNDGGDFFCFFFRCPSGSLRFWGYLSRMDVRSKVNSVPLLLSVSCLCFVQLFASRGVIRSTASALSLESASEWKHSICIQNSTFINVNVIFPQAVSSFQWVSMFFCFFFTFSQD